MEQNEAERPKKVVAILILATNKMRIYSKTVNIKVVEKTLFTS